MNPYQDIKKVLLKDSVVRDLWVGERLIDGMSDENPGLVATKLSNDL